MTVVWKDVKEIILNDDGYWSSRYCGIKGQLVLKPDAHSEDPSLENELVLKLVKCSSKSKGKVLLTFEVKE